MSNEVKEISLQDWVNMKICQCCGVEVRCVKDVPVEFVSCPGSYKCLSELSWVCVKPVVFDSSEVAPLVTKALCTSIARYPEVFKKDKKKYTTKQYVDRTVLKLVHSPLLGCTVYAYPVVTSKGGPTYYNFMLPIYSVMCGLEEEQLMVHSPIV